MIGRFAAAAMLLAVSACSRPAQTVSDAPQQDTPASQVFVHLFEWDWPSIGRECEEFLGPAGYSAVQVSPPQEHVQGPQWWTRYQPVSYRLVSRGGTREQFAAMVASCAAAGVDVYVDAVINHMTGVGTGSGAAGSAYGVYEYPGLYVYDDFHHCGRNGTDDIVDFDDLWELRNCELVNLADLKTGDSHVQETLAAYLNDLLGLGVRGLRLDAAKHMAPGDIAAVLARLEADAYVFQEVIAGGPVTTDMYLANGAVTEFAYHAALDRAFLEGPVTALRDLGTGSDFTPSESAVVFVDNHDTQRGHGGDTLSYKSGDRYLLANVFMLAWPYGYPKVMSSFEFDDREAGPPQAAPVAPDGQSCNAGWVCEHRQPAIVAMVAFRHLTRGLAVTHWQEFGDTAISFGRGALGHVVINAGVDMLDVAVRTDMNPGRYCNVLSAAIDALPCAGAEIEVTDSGRFSARLAPGSALAIHAGARLD